MIKQEKIKLAEKCLMENGIAEDEAAIVLQAIGYTLLDEELYPEGSENPDLKNGKTGYTGRNLQSE